MRLLTKAYWELVNAWTIHTAHPNSLGVLPHRKKLTDYIFGGVTAPSLFAGCNIAWELWPFDQQDFVICIFASHIKAVSVQEGKRYSVKAMVKMARRLKLMRGPGWSWLRAPLDIGKKFGYLPYELMPDEIGDQTWEQYSKDDLTDEQLQIMAQNKAPDYHRVTSAVDAQNALQAGYALVTANDWYTAMNYPAGPNFLLLRQGQYVCGHAWCVVKADKGRHAYVNPQTFGFMYGDHGKAYIQTLFGPGQYDVYLIEKMLGRTDADRFLGVFTGQCVKGSASSVYFIENGTKRGFASMDAYQKVNTQIYSIPDELLAQIPDGDLFT